MTASVARRYTALASHQVDALAAPWNERHEHLYTIEVVASGVGPVVVDTDHLDRVWNDLRLRWEGQYLNNSIGGPTTVEDLAARVLRAFREHVPEVAYVVVWEDDDRWGRAE